MAQLLVQADDMAISHATTLGVLESMTTGIVRNTGMFTNVPDAEFAARKLKQLEGVDVGVDLNFVTGRPLLPPAKVPGLVTSSGAFRSSHEIRAAHNLVKQDGFYSTFDPDPFDHDEALAEARAQVHRFIDLMDRLPAYLHHHSLVSTVTDQVMHEVAAEFGVLIVDDLLRYSRVAAVPNEWYSSNFSHKEQAEADPIAAFERALPGILATELSLLIVHPGYVDAALLDLSSFNVIRARDLELVTSPVVAALLASEGVELVTWSATGLANHKADVG
jgi:predicted glycoside hydrolase/deacetylase ChbG (UPF0249 family)